MCGVRERQHHTWSLVLWGLIALCGCSPQASELAKSPQAQAPQPLTVSAGDPVLFRFIDPGTKKVGTATRLEDVPEASRSEVIVMSDVDATPPGWEHVVDLSKGLPCVSTPTQGYVLKPAIERAASPNAKASKGGHEVVMFSTRGCGFCRKAAKFFKANNVPFTEFDIERDRQASATLAAMAKASKTPLADVQGGVPVIFVNGKPHVGFDQPKISRLLGI